MVESLTFEGLPGMGAEPVMDDRSRRAPSGLAGVRAEIEAACRRAGRDPAAVTLVAVSKTFGADAIEPVRAAA